MRLVWPGVLLLMIGLCIGSTSVLADILPGETVEERAVNGAREYIKKNNLKNPTLTMLMIARFKNALPALTKQWEELTGVKIKFVEVTYADSAAKIMAEAVAKTGAYDLFNQFPSVVPDAAGAGVILPLDEYAAKGQPDFSGMEAPLRAQQSRRSSIAPRPTWSRRCASSCRAPSARSREPARRAGGDGEPPGRGRD